MAQDLVIRIKGQNDTSAAFSDVRSGLGGIQQAAQQTGGFLSNVFSNAGGMLLSQGITTAARAVQGAFGAILSESQEAQEGLAQLNAVLTSTGGAAGMTAEEVLALSSRLSAANGLSKFSDDAVLAGNNLLLTFTQIGKDVFPLASQAAVDMAQALGGDPVSQATMLGKALNDPIQGISALTRVGVTFSDEQKKVIASLVETGDVAGAQKIILEELGREFGGSAAAAAQTFSGKMATLRERLNGVAEGIGTKFMPLMEKVVEAFSSPAVMAAVENFANGIVEGLGRVFDFAADLGERFGGAFEYLQRAFQSGDFFAVFEDGSSYVGGFLEALGVAEPIANAVGSALGWLTDVVGWLFTHLEGAKQVVLGVVASLGSFGILSTIAGWFASAGLAVASAGGIMAALSGVLAPVGAVLATMLSPVGLLAGAIGLLAVAWAKDWGGIREKVQGAVTAIAGALLPRLMAAFEWVQRTAGNAFQLLKDGWATLVEAFSGGGSWVDSDVIHPFHRVIGILGTVASAIADFASGNASEGIGKLLGLNIDPALIASVFGVVQTAIAILKNLASTVVEVGQALLSGNISGAISRLAEGIGTGLGLLAPLFSNLLPIVQAALGNVVAFVQAQLPAWQAQLGQWAQAFVGWLGDAVPPLLASLGLLLGTIGEWALGTALPTIVGFVQTWAPPFFDWIVTGVLPFVAEKLGQLLAAIGTWVTGTAIPGIVGFVKEFGPPFLDWITNDVIPLVAEKLGALLTAISTWITGTAVPGIVAFVKEFGPPFLDWIADEVIPFLAAKLDLVVAEIRGWVSGAVEGVRAQAGRIGDAILGGISSAITAGLGLLRQKLEELADLLPQWVRDRLGIASPSRVFRALAHHIPEGMALGIEDGTSLVRAAVQSVASAALDAFSARFANRESIPGLVSFAEQMGVVGETAGLNFMDSMIQGIRDRVAPMADELRAMTIRAVQASGFGDMFGPGNNPLAVDTGSSGQGWPNPFGPGGATDTGSSGQGWPNPFGPIAPPAYPTYPNRESIPGHTGYQGGMNFHEGAIQINPAPGREREAMQEFMYVLDERRARGEQ